LAALAHLKIKPRDEAENAAAQARAERLYEELLGSKREMVGRWIAEFLRALESDDPKEVARARALLTERLDQVDVEPIF
jgi:molecular chaperone HscC